MLSTRGIQRVMKEGNLPFRVGLRQRLLQPVHLRRGHVGAVEREELGVALPERVVALSVHVERLVVPLRRIVVIAERRVELHAGLENRLVRLLELLHEVGRSLAAVHVVAHHDDEVVREARARLGQQLRNLILRAAPRAGIADDGELDGVLRIRQTR
jgi:hypothetical protein